MANVEMIWAIVKAILIAAGAAGFRAYLGYLKSRTNEDFDFVKAGTTVGIGAILGLVAGLVTAAGYAQTPESIQDLLVFVGLFGFLTMAVEDAVKALYRYLEERLGN